MKPKIAVWIASVLRYAVVTTKERSFIASSIRPVATIWLSAPSSSHGQNAAAGHGMGSPVTATTTAKKTIENGKPNRKRILVAPQVPSGPVNDRCIALRATWPSAAMMVKGIQSEATESMENTGGRLMHRAGRDASGQQNRRHDRIARAPQTHRRPCERRDPYAVLPDVRPNGRRLVTQLAPWSMGPCVRRDDTA